MKKTVKYWLLAGTALLSLALLLTSCGAKDGQGNDSDGSESDTSHTHAFGNWEVVREATTAREGEARRSCSCGESESRTLGRPFSSGLAYAVNEDGATCSITGIGDCTDTALNIPERMGGYTVTRIDQYAFEDCAHLRKVFLPATVTEIGEAAFYACTALDEITLPEGLTAIGEGAFGICLSLTSLELPASLTSIGGGAFFSCNCLVEVLNRSALPLSLGSEDHGGVVYYAKNLYTPTEGQSRVTEVDGYVFYNDEGKYLLMGYKGEATELVLPETVNGERYAIGDAAFGYINWLTAITLPEGLNEIGFASFMYCTGLTRISLPSTLTTIGENAFGACYRLIEIYNASALMVEAGATDHGYLALNAKNVYTPREGVSKLKTEGDYLFYLDGENRYLVTYLGEGRELILPDGAEGKTYRILAGAFYNFSRITAVTIPAAVTAVGNDAFGNCDALRTVYYLSDCGGYRFGNGVERIVFGGSTVPAGVCPLGAETVELRDTVRSIEPSAFRDCRDLREIVIPGSVKTIGENAFLFCESLTSVTLSEGLEEIGISAFQQCRVLESIVIPDSVREIGRDAFEGCGALTTVTIGVGVERIGCYVFSGNAEGLEISYRGTRAQWTAIAKDSAWAFTSGGKFVHCKDGDVGLTA